MKKLLSLFVILAAPLLFSAPVHADHRHGGGGHGWEGQGWGDHGHHHDRDWDDRWHRPRHHHGYGPVVIERYYVPPPVRYRPYWRDRGPAYYPAPVPRYYDRPRHEWRSDASGALPIAAGGVIGGLIGEQLGYGNHGAIIAGSVAGAVLGHEIGR